jgi:hypothetical protein
MAQVICPMCGRGGSCEELPPVAADTREFNCEACGRFRASGSVVAHIEGRKDSLTLLQRSALSHRVRTAPRGQGEPLLTTYLFDAIVKAPQLPSQAVVAANLIRVVGDHASAKGEGYLLHEEYDAPLVGVLNRAMLSDIIEGLAKKELLNERVGPSPNLRRIKLTLDGWERYEAERHGGFAGNYGFLALKFGDSVLDCFVEAHIKPVVKGALGYDVVDMRDVISAGIIDNLMRQQIRDAAFVIADLTHDNYGAYWEAGYAEGVGKPVIYICESAKFEHAKTHFDTNHCTTVPWSEAEPTQFREQLIATLRRSLNLFPTTPGKVSLMG